MTIKRFIKKITKEFALRTKIQTFGFLGTLVVRVVWVVQVVQVVQVTQVLQMVQVFMVVKVVQVVQIVQVVQVISLDDLHPENMSSTWSKSSNYYEKLRCQACTRFFNCVYSSCYIF